MLLLLDNIIWLFLTHTFAHTMEIQSSYLHFIRIYVSKLQHYMIVMIHCKTWQKIK
nr:MAG TPA: hypothetical protein [Caudoviricetes sp.]